jgi:hypothetical protein
MTWWQWWLLASVILCSAYSLMRSRQKRRETYNWVFTA